MSDSERTISGISAAFCYLVITAIFVASAVTYLTAQVDQSSYNSGLYTGIIVWLFGFPAFFLGLILFALLDWGFKTLWKKGSRFGLIPIAIALSIPFIWEHFQAPESNDILIPGISAVALLACSVFVVRLQIGSGYQAEKEKPKHGE